MQCVGRAFLAKAMKKSESRSDRWISVHLYYYEDLERALRHFLPLLAHKLIAERQVLDRFYFIRYYLGGPHLRLRFRCLPGRRNVVERIFRESAEEFLEAWPSGKAIDPADIARANEGILRSDPFEQDDSIYPDNSFRVFPFRAEVDRYGGESLFRHSLDFFCVSSLAVLDFLESYGAWSRPKFLSGAARLLFAQAIGLAGSLGHLKELLGYAFEEKWGPVTKKADSFYEQKRSAFQALIRGVSAEIVGSAPKPKGRIPWAEILHAAAKFLARDIRAGDRLIQARILGSQMHMTANRMGLRNADEVYLGHLLHRALEDDLLQEASLHAAAIASAAHLPEAQGCDSVAEVAARSLSAWLPRIALAKELSR